MRKCKTFATAFAAVALLAVPAGAQAADRDGDDLPDRWEARNGLSTSVKSANRDSDRDRVDNRNEYREGTRPRDKDSDDDGLRDGREDRDHDGLRNAAEDASGNDPVDRDTDDDGTRDGNEQAGVVTAYDGGILTIELSNGDKVTGRVTGDTEVECLAERTAEDEQESGDDASTSRRGGGGSEEGSNDDDDESGEHGDRGGSGSGGGDGDRERRGGRCGDRNGDADHAECPAGTLAVGARIHEALLKASTNGAVFREIEVLTR